MIISCIWGNDKDCDITGKHEEQVVQGSSPVLILKNHLAPTDTNKSNSAKLWLECCIFAVILDKTITETCWPHLQLGEDKTTASPEKLQERTWQVECYDSY